MRIDEFAHDASVTGEPDTSDTEYAGNRRMDAALASLKRSTYPMAAKYSLR